MFPRCIVILLNFYDLFGYNSRSSSLVNYPIFMGFIRFFHISIIIFLTFIQFRLLNYSIASFGILDMVNDFVQYSAPLYTNWLIIFESIFQQHSHSRFWKIVAQINQQYRGQFEQTYRCYVFKFIEFFVCTITLFWIMFFSMMESMETLNIVLPYLIIIQLFHIRIFYYLLCLEVVQNQLTIIEYEIKNTKYSTNILDTGKKIREHFYRVYELVNLLNGIFGWSQVVAVPCCFYLLLTDCNWLYAHNHSIETSQTIGVLFYFSY